jgi:hypothetical protein
MRHRYLFAVALVAATLVPISNFSQGGQTAQTAHDRNL